MGSKCCSLLQKDDLEPRLPAGVRQPHFTGLRCTTLINATWPRSASSEPPRDREQTGGAENQYRAWIRCPKEKKENLSHFQKSDRPLALKLWATTEWWHSLCLLFFFFPSTIQSVYLHIMSCLSAVIRSHYFQKAQHSLLDSGMPSSNSLGFIYLFWMVGL